ncbi:protein LAZY 1 isoform X1 [Ziziphus jujuba]|uniref:Protein LAZY 1 isoform X1 n=1 Tax=Ziziphus jujuba TaxID=326968 RepID=A0ABM3ZT03_ZIZJJ|nr:protein LAZY 1 isoform X1 [Ziziphus jujuba]
MKMKLLDWMHHKFRHSSTEPYKDLNIAQSSVDDQESYTKPNFGSRYGSKSLKPPKQEQENYFSQIEANIEEETSTIISELFHGFLTIGTLGSEPNIAEPETPTFATPLENTTETKPEVTENDLKLIGYELEKFLEAESKEGFDESSGRNSHVSATTLCCKQVDEAGDEDSQKTVTCPLQGYLFGSSVELPEIRTEVKKEKASLAELFQITKITAENCTGKREIEDIQSKHRDKSATHFMKKIIKKLHALSKHSTPFACGYPSGSDPTKKKPDHDIDSVSAKNKLQKVLHMFHRKIHPESSIVARELLMSGKCNLKHTRNDSGYTNGNLIHLGGNNRKFSRESKTKDGKQCHKNQMKLPQCRVSSSNLSGKGEHWIKTDADCTYYFPYFFAKNTLANSYQF